MNDSPECIVIGAGAAGIAASLALARRGARVRLIEQHALGHDRGSSHGPTRLLRIAYFEHPAYAPLARRSLELWRALEAEAGVTLFRQTGLAVSGPERGTIVPGVRRAASEHALPVREILPGEARRRFPWLRFEKSHAILFEQEAGFILAEKAMAAQTRLLARAGCEIRDNERALDWSSSSDKISVRTDKAVYSADRLIVCAGAWARSLLGEIAPVTPVEKSLFWFAPGDARFMQERSFPPFMAETQEGRFFYGFPAIDQDGVKIAEHSGGREIGAPEERRGAPAPDEIGAVSRFLSVYAPRLPRSIGRSASCLYEMSPDGHFIIGKSPRDARIVFAAGLSGHGFKFAPAIGEALSDICLGRPARCDMSLFSPMRFNAR